MACRRGRVGMPLWGLYSTCLWGARWVLKMLFSCRFMFTPAGSIVGIHGDLVLITGSNGDGFLPLNPFDYLIELLSSASVSTDATFCLFAACPMLE